MINILHEKREHELDPAVLEGSPVIQAIYRFNDGTVEAASDPRHRRRF